MQLLLRYVPRYVGRVLSSESQEKSGKVAFVKKLHSFPALVRPYNIDIINIGSVQFVAHTRFVASST